MTNTVPKPGKSSPALHPAAEHALEGSALTATNVNDFAYPFVLHTV